MGAGFGHTYTVYNNSYSALAFSLGAGDSFESAEDLRECLETLKTITVTFKGRTFDVAVGIESTYNGDDLCLVPSNLWDAYAEVIENAAQEYGVINWSGVAKFEDALQAAFELALCEVFLQEFPHMWTRKRILGWCGTTYKPVADYILGLKKQ